MLPTYYAERRPEGWALLRTGDPHYPDFYLTARDIWAFYRNLPVSLRPSEDGTYAFCRTHQDAERAAAWLNCGNAGLSEDTVRYARCSPGRSDI